MSDLFVKCKSKVATQPVRRADSTMQLDSIIEDAQIE